MIVFCRCRCCRHWLNFLIESAREKRAKLLAFIVKYANLRRPCLGPGGVRTLHLSLSNPIINSRNQTVGFFSWFFEFKGATYVPFMVAFVGYVLSHRQSLCIVQ